MLRFGLVFAVLFAAVQAGAAQAQRSSRDEQGAIAEMKRQIETLQRRVEELEGRPRETKPTAKRRAAPVPAAPPRPAEITAPPVIAAPTPRAVATVVPGLLPPEPMGSQFEDALRSDLPGLSIRIPGTWSEVRFYGFAKVSGWGDFNGRNQTDAPPPQTIPLANSPAALQGGDMGMTGRFSRLGMDTRTLTGWGTLETRIEGDFGGTAGTSISSVNDAFRLRQAWAELGTERFRVLIGQANSLWNEGMFETLIDATNLNQSFIRQAQIRATGLLAPGLTGQISLEAPETQYTSVAGVFTPASSPFGGLSPALTYLPDLLGRLNYRYDGLEFDIRGLARELSIRTAGTAAAPPATTKNAFGGGLAAHVRFPMRWLSETFGPDQLIVMGYYGRGIGRYFAGNTFGQDALSNIGLPGTNNDFSFDPLPTYGTTLAYRRFWTPQLRSNFAYGWAWEDYPAYGLAFTPGSPSAVLLNSSMQQGIANLIWSPFAELGNNGTVNTGWLDVGLEYVYTQRNVFGGSVATAGAGTGSGTANRLLGAAVARF